jgi:hypothetical protein
MNTDVVTVKRIQINELRALEESAKCRRLKRKSIYGERKGTLGEDIHKF